MKIVCLTLLIMALTCLSCAQQSLVRSPNPINPAPEIAKNMKQKAVIKQFPYTAQLRIVTSRFDKGDNCTGAVISEGYILTAAHCFREGGIKDILTRVEVILGVPNRWAAQFDEHRVNMDVPPSSIHVHPKYAKYAKYTQFGDPNTAWRLYGHKNDIAIIALPRPIESFNDYIQAIRLPTSREALSGFDYYSAVSSGWGKFLITDAFASDDLHFINFNIMSKTSCLRKYTELSVISLRDTTMCVISPKEDSTVCKGDSGGPLAVKIDGKPVLAGVATMSGRYCDVKEPGIFTNVIDYLPWIRATAKIVEAEPDM